MIGKGIFGGGWRGDPSTENADTSNPEVVVATTVTPGDIEHLGEVIADAAAIGAAAKLVSPTSQDPEGDADAIAGRISNNLANRAWRRKAKSVKEKLVEAIEAANSRKRLTERFMNDLYDKMYPGNRTTFSGSIAYHRFTQAMYDRVDNTDQETVTSVMKDLAEWPKK